MAKDTSLDDIRAMLERDNEDEESTAPESDDPESTKGKDNATLKALRDFTKRQERELKKATSELEDLRAFRDKAVEQAQDSALAAAGLSPRQRTVFLKAYEDVSAENIAEFKSEVLGATAEGEVEVAPFGVGSSTGESGLSEKKLDRAGFEKLWREKGPEAARKAYAEGRVAFKGQ